MSRAGRTPSQRARTAASASDTVVGRRPGTRASFPFSTTNGTGLGAIHSRSAGSASSILATASMPQLAQ